MGKKPIVSVTYENENFYVHGVHKNPKNGINRPVDHTGGEMKHTF